MTSEQEKIESFVRAVDKREREDLERFRHMRNRTPREAFTDESPDEILMAREGSKPPGPWELRMDTVSRAFAYIASKGPHPAKLLLQIYRLGKYLHHPLFSAIPNTLTLFADADAYAWLMGKIAGSDDLAVKREREIQRALLRFKNRTGYEVRTERVALDFVLSKEDDTDEWEMSRAMVHDILTYVGADGDNPRDILRLLFVLGSHMAFKPFCEFTLREKKLLLGGSHGTHHWIMKKRGEDPLRRLGARSWKGPAQKTLGSRKNYSRSQKGNTNRRTKK